MPWPACRLSERRTDLQLPDVQIHKYLSMDQHPQKWPRGAADAQSATVRLRARPHHPPPLCPISCRWLPVPVHQAGVLPVNGTPQHSNQPRHFLPEAGRAPAHLLRDVQGLYVASRRQASACPEVQHSFQVQVQRYVQHDIATGLLAATCQGGMRSETGQFFLVVLPATSKGRLRHCD